MKPLRILHTVESYFPSVGGMQAVVRQLSERLAAQGHSVTVATSRNPGRSSNVINGVNVESFDCGGNIVDGLTGTDQRRYVDFVLNGAFDVVVLFAAQQWATDLLLPVLTQISARKFFVPTGFSTLYEARWRPYFEGPLISACRSFDQIVLLGEDYRDGRFLREHGISNLVVIPNAADEKEFQTPPPPGHARRSFGLPEDWVFILLVGSHTGRKGHAEAIELFRRAKLKKAALVIIGNTYSRSCFWKCTLKAIWHNLTHRSSKITIAEIPRAMTVDSYFDADLFLFPSQIECSPLVLFESMASSTPFLATDVGNSGEILGWSDDAGEILPTVFDEQGYSLLQVSPALPAFKEWVGNAEKRKAAGERGRDRWKSRFTWAAVTTMYENLYRGSGVPRSQGNE